MSEVDLKSYRPLSISARHGVALCCMELFCKKYGLDHVEMNKMIKHQWEWSTLNANRFDEWAEKKPRLVWIALGDEYEGDLEEFLVKKGVDPVEFRELIESVAEIIDWNLYGNIDEEKSFEFLTKVLALSMKHGLQIPEASHFMNSTFKDNHGWGKKLTPKERDQWRLLANPNLS